MEKKYKRTKTKTIFLSLSLKKKKQKVIVENKTQKRDEKDKKEKSVHRQFLLTALFRNHDLWYGTLCNQSLRDNRRNNLVEAPPGKRLSKKKKTPKTIWKKSFAGQPSKNTSFGASFAPKTREKSPQQAKLLGTIFPRHFLELSLTSNLRQNLSETFSGTIPPQRR